MNEKLNRVFDRTKPSPEQKEAMLNRLLEPERKVKPMKNLKKLTIVAVAAALTVISCAAAAVTGIDRRLLDYFGAGPEDTELLSPAAVAVDRSHTYENGWTVEISQVLADRLFLAVLVDVTAPEGVVLSREERLLLGISQLDGQGNPVNSGGALLGFIRQLEDGDPTDNHMTVLWQVRRTKGEESVPYIGGSLTLIPRGVSFREGERMVPTGFMEEDGGEWWSCTVELPDTDPGMTWDMDRPLSIGEAQVRLTGLYLSPLSLTVYVEDKEQRLRAPEWEDPENHREEWEAYWETQQTIREEGVFLNLRDGTRLPAAESQGMVAGVSYTFRFDQIFNLEEAVSVTLFGQTFELK